MSAVYSDPIYEQFGDYDLHGPLASRQIDCYVDPFDDEPESFDPGDDPFPD